MTVRSSTDKVPTVCRKEAGTLLQSFAGLRTSRITDNESAVEGNER